MAVRNRPSTRSRGPGVEHVTPDIERVAGRFAVRFSGSEGAGQPGNRCPNFELSPAFAIIAGFMARITRRELKRNELVESFDKTVDYVSHHRRGAVEALAAVGVVVLIAAGFFFFRGWRERQAGRELSAALGILETPLAGDPAAASAPRTFATAAERESEAVKHLKAASEKGGTAAGRAAQVILVARGEKSAQSPATLAKAARDEQAEVAAAAEIDSARLLSADGKTTEAIDRLKRAIESPKSAAPKDALLFALAETYEKAGSSADARATYQRIVNDYPNSPYRTDARQKIGG